MKKFALLLIALFFVSCGGDSGPIGPEGPPGPVGPEGPPGSEGLIGQAFEVNANFNAENAYSEQFFFSEVPDLSEVLESDIVVVYWLFEENEQSGNDVWQQLPASVFFDDGGEMQYAFDHTLEDVQLFLQGDIELGTVGAGYTENQYFRVVILPVDYVQAKNINMSNMKEVMKTIGKQKLKRIKL